MQSNSESASADGGMQTAAAHSTPPSPSNPSNLSNQRLLAAALLQRHPHLWPRFLAIYTRLEQLPRRWRRRLARKAAAAKVATTLAGVAILLALGRTPLAHAAEIEVDGVTCTLVDAILSAERGNSYGGCDPGNGADTLILTADITLASSYATYYESYTALPLVTTTITIEGNGHTIERDTADPDKFRFLAVSNSGDLTINEVTFSGGHAYTYVGPGYYDPDLEGDGGAIFSNGLLTISESTFSGNEASESGGAIYSDTGTIHITNSEISSNISRRGGGIGTDAGTIIIHDSTFSLNETTTGNGGAIYLDAAASHVTITNSTISENKAYFTGGALHSEYGTVEISDSFIYKNEARNDGGAFYIDFKEASLTITNSTISGNESGDQGGALRNWAGTVTLINSTVSNNSAEEQGGAIYNNNRYATLTITNSLISGNHAQENGGGIYNWQGKMTITGSAIYNNYSAQNGGGVYIKRPSLPSEITNTTINDNKAKYNGGGIYVDNDEVVITNSTISNNEAGVYGGGLFNAHGATSTLNNTTITGNEAGTAGGGLFNDYFLYYYNDIYIGRYYGTMYLNRNLVAGNHAPSGRELYNDGGFTYADAFNLFGFNGNAGVDNSGDGVNFAPGANDLVPTEPLAEILKTTLAANGGPTTGAAGTEQPLLTHALLADSPAIDAAPTADCTAAPVGGVDQRGKPRNEDGDDTPSTNECDIGAYELQPQMIYMTAAGSGTTANGVSFGKEDILVWDGLNWSKFFDGTNEGLTAKHDLNAIHVVGEDDIYLSFFQNKINTANVGQVMGTDILHYNGSGFTLYFDGSDVGLEKVAQEKIDALHILDDGTGLPGGGSCEAYLLISTFGTGKVPAAGGGNIKFQGEDILGFCLTNSGANTAGGWHMVLDGSAEGMPKNSTDSISASADGQTIYLTTKGTFNVDAAFGGHSMVYEYDRVSDEFSGPHFSAPANGLNQKVDGLHLEG